MVCKEMTTPSSRITKTGRRIPYLSKNVLYVKCSHILACPVKLIFCGLSPFYKIGAIKS
jgi:hypothetical protein